MNRLIRSVLYCALALCSTSSLANLVNLVVNPDFEISESLGNGTPNILGNWDGDDATIVSNENGISPLNGSRMLRFDFSDSNGPNPISMASEVIQLIDTSAYLRIINAGSAIAHASFYFNRVIGDAQTDTAFGLRMRAHNGDPSSFRSNADKYLKETYIESLSDSNIATWELINGDLLLPIGTTFITIWIASVENIYNDGRGLEFDGHYADKVNVNVNVNGVPLPGTVWLLGMGLAGIAALRRKSKTVKIFTGK